MRSLNISGAAVIDLQDTTNKNRAPFQIGYTATVLNTTTNAESLKSSDAATGPWTTMVDVAAGEAEDVVINNRYLTLGDGAGNLVLLGN